MNRIVLIGNGFDLAHELPTRYEDFLLGYFKKAIKSCKENKENQTGLEYTKKEIDYKNRLIEVQYNEPFSAIQDEDFTSLNNLFRSGKYYFEHLENGGVDQIDYLFGGDVRECTITIKSDFFKQLLARKYRRWADIEGYYFEYLTNAYEAGGFSREKKILELNVDFEEVKNALVEYLKEVNTDIMSKVKANGTWDNILGYCVSKIGDKDFNLFFNNISFDPTNQELNHTYFLNFNYTSYLDICVAENDWGNRSVIPIHGRIEDVEGVIFGYGDDTHEKYHKLEQDGNDELLLNIKSFYYADHQRYLDIINNLDEREYEVVVIGHSLGLSDRVLLKTIFEHKNCAAIRLYHRGGEKGRRNHFKKRIALSRHFEDKLAMRGKIIPYNDRDVFN